MNLKEQFEAHASSLPATTERERDLYQAHFDLLCSWNERMSLVSPNSLKTAIATHYADSLFIADFARAHQQKRDVLDLGTGAGFPGLVFAIRFPDTHVTLFEKSLKKQSFLAVAVAQLELENVLVDGAFPEGRRAGLFLARAVMPPDKLFLFLQKKMWNKSTVITNYGGSKETPAVPNYFDKLGETRYSLPLDCGDRVAQALTLK